MRLPPAIEREIQAIEREIASRGGQQVGPPWFRELRAAIGLELQRRDRDLLDSERLAAKRMRESDS